MRIQILGKSHRKGVSKTGNAYDFTEVHYLRSSKYVEGLAATTKTIGADVCDYAQIVVNGYLDIEFDETGAVIRAVPVEDGKKPLQASGTQVQTKKE